MSDGPSEANVSTRTTAMDEVDIAIDPTELQRLNPRVQLLWLFRVAVTAVILGAIGAGVGWWIGYDPGLTGAAVGTAVVILGVPHTVLAYRIWGYTVREDSLYLQRGVLVRIQTVVPYVRIQHVDTSRSPLERLTSLSSSVIYTAGSRGADVRIPGLEPDRARTLQERLKDLANVTEDDAV